MEGGIMESPDETLGNGDYDDDALRGCCGPSKRPFRFVGLVLMCLLGFGSYFCYDNPAALQDNFKKDLGLTTSNFVLLYSVYSWPNVVFCFIGGFLVDRVFGIRNGTIIYMAVTLIGQIIFASGATINAFWLMLVGRLVFGIGAESLAVAQNSYAVLWFKGKELNMVFGLQLSSARVGSTVNFWSMEPLYKYVGKMYSGPTCIGVVLFLSSLTCVFSMWCTCVLGLMDKRAERILKRGHGREPEVVRLSDVKYFKGVFWLVVIVCIAYYMAIFPFIALGKVYFEKKYNYDPESANSLDSLVFLISAIASPLLGALIDTTGRNVFWVCVSVCGSIVAHGLFAFSYVNPYYCMVLLGLTYSMLASSLWPLIALVTPEYQLGTAYGIAQAGQNLGLAVVSIIAGMIADTAGYFILELFFLGWLWIALLTSVAIWILDSATTGGFLNMTPGERKIYESSRASQDSQEREQLLTNDSTSDLLSDDVLSSQSDIRIRNRYLARIGAALPTQTKASINRPLR